MINIRLWERILDMVFPIFLTLCMQLIHVSCVLREIWSSLGTHEVEVEQRVAHATWIVELFDVRSNTVLCHLPPSFALSKFFNPLLFLLFLFDVFWRQCGNICATKFPKQIKEIYNLLLYSLVLIGHLVLLLFLLSIIVTYSWSAWLVHESNRFGLGCWPRGLIFHSVLKYLYI